MASENAEFWTIRARSSGDSTKQAHKNAASALSARTALSRPRLAAFAVQALCGPLERNNRQMPSPAVEVDAKREPIAWLARYQRPRARAR